MSKIKVSIEVLKAMKLLLNSSCKDETRQHLCGVHMSFTPDNKVKLEATNGYILNQYLFEEEDLALLLREQAKFNGRFSRDGIIIENEIIKKIKFNKKCDSFTFKRTDNDCFDLEVDGCVYLIEPIVREYPKTSAFIPDQKNLVDHKDSVSIRFSIETFQDMLKSLNYDKKRGTQVEFVFNRKKKFSPVLVKQTYSKKVDDDFINVIDDDHLGLLMPLK